MNGEANCILQVCCPPEAATAALAREMVKDGVCEKEYAPKIAAWINQHFDLAPAGSLTAFKAEIKRLARENGGKDSA